MAATMHGGSSGAWSYAVPLEETDGNARAYNPRVSQHADQEWQENGNKALQRSSSAWDLLSDSETAKQRRTSVRANNSTAVRKRSRNTLRDNKKLPQSAAAAQKGKAGGAYAEQDNSPWVHRDKLAQIEIQEMEEAGIYVRPSRRSQSLGPGRENGRSRSVSRSGARKSAHDPLNGVGYDEQYAAAYPSRNDMNMDHAPTPLASPHEENQSSRSSRRAEPYFDPIENSESRASEETATNLESNDDSTTKPFSPQAQQQQHVARPSTSRIPVSRISPVPVPHNVVERDSPLPRSRAGSQSVSGSWDEQQYARKARSASISSQVLLESDLDSKKTTPPASSNKDSSGEGSPQKVRVPKQTPTGRKSSIPNSVGAATRPSSSAGKRAPLATRAPSAAATRRPGSSSGHKSRPSTGHFVPDGEAPWIATMYKPDPRLPPDQQILPTHAKRIMQEQWEKEGKTGTVYDKDFNLLNDEDLARKAPVLTLQSQNLDVAPPSTSPTKSSSPNGSSTGNGWPLDPKSESGSARRPGTSGGYKITPTISSTPTIRRAAPASPVPPQPMSPPHNATPRVPELSEKEETVPKKGCCCVVM